jgi:dTDP-4-amino-4,6-dideoxygalactose transaminase
MAVGAKARHMVKPADLHIRRDATLRDALLALDRTGAGHLLLVDDCERLLRMITDGDLRRLLLATEDAGARLSALPPAEPVTARMDTPVDELVALFARHAIAAIPRLDEDGRVCMLEQRDSAGPILLSTPHLGDEEQKFVKDAFDSNWIAPLGPQVERFERELAEYSGNAHVAALSSGTAALHLGLILLGVKDGDRVYCSSFTFAASANPIRYQRAEPVFIDSDPDTWNMSPAALERALAADKARGTLPRAIVIADLYGQSADMDPLLALCDAYSVPVLEDAAESLGAKYKGRMSGSFGRISIFSFNGNKIITTSGGGALCSADEDLVSRARFLATQAREPAVHYEHSEIGYNYRLSNVLAGIGRGQLRVIDDRIRRRRAIFSLYREGLQGLNGIDWMPEPDGFFSTRWLSALLLGRRAGVNSRRVLEGLRVVGIEGRPLWKPMHRQPVFAGCDYFPHSPDHSVSDELFDGGLCLPSGSNLTDVEIERVIAQLRFLLQQ